MTRAKRKQPGPMYWRLLPDHSTKPCSDAEWIGYGAARSVAIHDGEPDPFRVAYTDLEYPCYVSTVFIGFDTFGAGHNVFETLARIGPGGVDEITRRAGSWAEAEFAHAAIVAEHRAAMAAHIQGAGDERA